MEKSSNHNTDVEQLMRCKLHITFMKESSEIDIPHSHSGQDVTFLEFESHKGRLQKYRKHPFQQYTKTYE